MRSKNSLIRERVIDSCLSDKTRRWSMLEIMEAVNQALREQCEEEVTAPNTIRDDIRAIETRCQVQVQMTRDGRRKFYRYEDPAFSIYHVRLSPEEREHLRLAMDENPYLRGIGYLPDLMDAIARRQAVRITYKPYRQKETRTMTFHPYCLKQWPYTESKPLHGSQKLKQRNPDGSVEIELSVIPNHELEQRILEHGAGFEVLSPLTYRHHIRDIVTRMMEHYVR